jgi:hypothetical protein
VTPEANLERISHRSDCLERESLVSKQFQKRFIGRNLVDDALESLPEAEPQDVGPVMERFGNIRDLGRSFDIEYWQRQGDSASFRAAWELVESFYRDRGLDPNELRLQRSLESFQRS